MTPYRGDEAENLNQQIDDMLSSQQSIQAAKSGKDALLRAGAVLASTPPPTLSPDARQRIFAKVQQRTLQNAQQRAFWRSPLIGRIAAVLLVLFMGGFVIASANNSMPGDSFYAVKLQAESMEVGLARTPEDRAIVFVNHANRRMDEAETMMKEYRLEPTLMQSALDNLNSAIEIANNYGLFELSQSFSELVVSAFDRYELVLNTALEIQALSRDEWVDLTAMRDSVANHATLLFAQNPVEENTQPTVDTVVETPVIDPIASIPTEEVPEDEPEVTETPDAPTVATDNASETAYIFSRSRVNVRSGAGIDYAVVAQIEPDQEVTILAVSDAGDWYEITTTSGIRGWIAAFLLTDSPISSNLETSNTNYDGSSGSSAACAERGNSCNAPGQEHSNGGNGNGNANGNGNGNGNGQGRRP